MAAALSGILIRHRRLALGLVLLSALLLRLGLFAAAWWGAADLHTLHTGDTPTYIEPAESLLTDGTFSINRVPEIYRTPGYPLLLTAGLSAGHFYSVTLTLQILISLASILLVYHLCRKLTGSPAAALAAAAMAAWEPLSIVFTSYVMPETLFTFLLLASLSLLLRYLETASLSALFAAALLLAAATFVRPITYYLPLGVMLLLVVRALVNREPRPSTDQPRVGRRCLLACLSAAGFAAVAMSPCVVWQVRNYVVTGYTGFTGIPDCNLYFFQKASVLARTSGKSLHEVQLELGQNDPELLAALHGPAQAATIRRLGADARRTLSEHPLEYAKIHLRGMIIWLLDPGGSDLLGLIGRHPAAGLGIRPLNSGLAEMFGRLQREAPELLFTTLGLGALLGLCYAAAALGLVASWRRFDWQWTLLLAVGAYLWLISGGPTGCARLRQPAMPIVCILAGWGVTCLVHWFFKTRNTASAKTAGVLVS